MPVLFCAFLLISAIFFRLYRSGRTPQLPSTPQKPSLNESINNSHDSTSPHPFSLSPQSARWMLYNALIARNDFVQQLRSKEFLHVENRSNNRGIGTVYWVRMYSILTFQHAKNKEDRRPQPQRYLDILPANPNYDGPFCYEGGVKFDWSEKLTLFTAETAIEHFSNLPNHAKTLQITSFFEGFVKQHILRALSSPHLLHYLDYTLLISHVPIFDRFCTEDDWSKSYAGGARIIKAFDKKLPFPIIKLNDLDSAFISQARERLYHETFSAVLKNHKDSTPEHCKRLAESVAAGFATELAACLICKKLIQWISFAAEEKTNASQGAKHTANPLSPTALSNQTRLAVHAYALQTFEKERTREIDQKLIRYPNEPLQKKHAARRKKAALEKAYRPHFLARASLTLMRHGVYAPGDSRRSEGRFNLFTIPRPSKPPLLRFWGSQLAKRIRQCPPYAQSLKTCSV